MFSCYSNSRVDHLALSGGLSSFLFVCNMYDCILWYEITCHCALWNSVNVKVKLSKRSIESYCASMAWHWHFFSLWLKSLIELKWHLDVFLKKMFDFTWKNDVCWSFNMNWTSLDSLTGWHAQCVIFLSILYTLMGIWNSTDLNLLVGEC